MIGVRFFDEFDSHGLTHPLPRMVLTRPKCDSPPLPDRMMSGFWNVALHRLRDHWSDTDGSQVEVHYIA